MKGILAVLLACACPLSISAQEVLFPIAQFRVEGQTLINDSQIQEAVQPYLGDGRSILHVNAAAAAVKAAYFNAGYPIVKVFAPQQEAANGVVTLKVIEGKLAAIAIWGNKFHDETNIRNSLRRLIEGQAPNARRIVADIAMANESPARQIAVNLQAGENPGDVVAKVDVTDENPQRLSVNLDNGGSKVTGTHRVSLAYQHANLFNKDHLFTGQVTASPEHPDRSQSVSVGYRIPFYDWGISTDYLVAYSNSNSGETATPNGPMAFTGAGTVAAFRVNQPLPSVGEYRHKLSYGYDYKDFKNSCSSNGVALPASTCGTITSQPVSIAYGAQLRNEAFEAGATVSYHANVPGGPNGANGNYAEIARKSRWNAWRANAFVGIPLPGKWQVKVSFSGQTTGNRLIAGEQFGLGGQSSIRGYRERSIAGDEGLSGSVELYTPDFGPALPVENLNAQALAFYDYGTVSDKDGPSLSLSSAGLGLRLRFSKSLSLRVDAGVAQKPLVSATPGVTRNRGDAFVHINANYAF